ncbi:pyruvate, water dikinase regulatory protein [Paenibacillus sp. GCM10023252]|uniref:pyruvate, water dikinase regulatory protein n=1 Tax=Paenibacillus sp. GCM10023252 TaxID=3252649 RepID=UPI003613180D
MSTQQQIIYICSDAIGETAEAVAKATLRQFSSEQVQLKRYGHIKSEDEVISIVDKAERSGGFIAYTLVQPELRELMKEEAQHRGVRAVDVMGPMMQAYIDTFGSYPSREPGRLHSIDDSYYRRMEAMEFAVKYDDGKDTRGLTEAQVILIGVSRTSKTPLSIFLSHKGIKTANLPLMPEVKPPQELLMLTSVTTPLTPTSQTSHTPLIVGLTMQPQLLLDIRSERLIALGLPDTAKYATLQRIHEELAYAAQIMDELGCPVIDVSGRAIEETAGIITSWLDSRRYESVQILAT